MVIRLLFVVCLHVLITVLFDWSWHNNINRGYCPVARRYEFYFRVAKQYFTNECSEWAKYCFCHEKIKFISSSRRVMFFFSCIYKKTSIKNSFYSPKSNCEGSNLQYSNMTLVTIILRNNIELNRALQWQNIRNALKNVEVKFKRPKTPTNFEGRLPKLCHR